MSGLRPSGDELLAAVGRLLREKLSGEVEGVSRFQVRVAASLVDQARREAATQTARTDAERAGLQALLATDEPDLETLNRTLQQQLRSGRLGWRAPGVREHARRVVVADLDVSNPRWLREGSAP